MVQLLVTIRDNCQCFDSLVALNLPQLDGLTEEVQNLSKSMTIDTIEA
jgi:hypothetical protein